MVRKEGPDDCQSLGGHTKSRNYIQTSKKLGFSLLRFIITCICTGPLIAPIVVLPLVRQVCNKRQWSPKSMLRGSNSNSGSMVVTLSLGKHIFKVDASEQRKIRRYGCNFQHQLDSIPSNTSYSSIRQVFQRSSLGQQFHQLRQCQRYRPSHMTTGLELSPVTAMDPSSLFRMYLA